MAQRRTGQEASAVLTKTAYERLKAELEELTTTGRRRIAERLQHARELGDIRENAEYDAAKDEQALMESRIRTLQQLLKDPDLVEAPEEADRVAPGMLVRVRPVEGDVAPEDDEDEETYLLAASAEERAPGVRTVTPDSPLGRVLVGTAPGERVTYHAPGGRFSYEVVGFEPHGA